MPTARTTTLSKAETNEHVRAGFWFMGMALAIELAGGLALLLAYAIV